MQIIFNNNLRLVGNEHSWELQKPRKKNGKASWQSFKYYLKLSHALSEVGDRQIRLANGDSIEDALTALDTVRLEMQRILDLAPANSGGPRCKCSCMNRNANAAGAGVNGEVL